MTGTYAALGAIAALREARRSGKGEHVDVAMLDCMAVTMVTFPSVFASFSGWPEQPGTGRVIEVPSVEPSKDGYFNVTTNSAQQFQDFLLMIGRPDLLEDTDLASSPKRFARRDEFLAAVLEHTSQRTTAELLDEASLFRIPAGPVLDGSTMPEFEQFVARGVFVPNPSGRFVQPRVPFSDFGHGTAALRAGAGQRRAHRHHRLAAPAGAAPARPTDSPWQLPLQGIRVIDCTAWWAGPAAGAVLSALGADVIKVESVARPDYMRFASARQPTDDQWWEWGPLFHGANVNKRGITLDLTRPAGVEAFERLAATADVLVENYTPRVMEQFGLGWEHMHEVNPDLIMVRMPAFGLSGPWRDRTGFAQTMECLTGMAWLTGFPDGPPVLVRGACDPLAGMHAVIATIAGPHRARPKRGWPPGGDRDGRSRAERRRRAGGRVRVHRHGAAPRRQPWAGGRTPGGLPVRGRRSMAGPRRRHRRTVAVPSTSSSATRGGPPTSRRTRPRTGGATTTASTPRWPGGRPTRTPRS